MLPLNDVSARDCAVRVRVAHVKAVAVDGRREGRSKSRSPCRECRLLDLGLHLACDRSVRRRARRRHRPEVVVRMPGRVGLCPRRRVGPVAAVDRARQVRNRRRARGGGLEFCIAPLRPASAELKALTSWRSRPKARSFVEASVVKAAMEIVSVMTTTSARMSATPDSSRSLAVARRRIRLNLVIHAPLRAARSPPSSRP